ncbi:MAG: NAD(P)/FAD-dependent oxidoreductase [Marinibacterium sp.]
MPFEILGAGAKRIAVIGGGISGMGAAMMLAGDHRVTLFEAAPRLGGHARTVLAGRRGDQPVDMGFIVFNRVNYPRLTALFYDLDVPVVKSNMSFGVSVDGGRIEYGLASLDALFAQRRHAAHPAFLRMVGDLVRFNSRAEAALAGPDMTIGELLDNLRMGPWFRDYYLLPFSGAIWSTPKRQILDFPAYALIRFFQNHHLMQTSGQHQWYTVQGGSVEYVRRVAARLRQKGARLRTGAAVRSVRRDSDGVWVRARGGVEERFDEVVLAAHSDDALALLADARPRERAALEAIRYQPNKVVLHADAGMMPKRRKVWSSWVYTEDRAAPSDVIDLTYWMNSLQPIPQDDPLFVTLNSKRPICEDLIHRETVMRHPVYDVAALRAQGDVRAFNGADNTWFCGAWMRNGFHEDGLASAADVVAGMAERQGPTRMPAMVAAQ